MLAPPTKKSRKGLIRRVALMCPRGMQLRCVSNRILPPPPDKLTAPREHFSSTPISATFCSQFRIWAQIAVISMLPIQLSRYYLHIDNYIPISFTFHQCYVTEVMQSDWSCTIFNVGTRKLTLLTRSFLMCARRGWA